jgi:hypothetical protein
MFAEIRIYYEGGPSLRPGFDEFFRALKNRASERRCGFRLISGRATSSSDFGIAIKSHTNAWNILLQDSEGPDTGNLSASLCQRMGWDQSHADSVFWMVEMMESWFHAHKNNLEKFYGGGFKINALKPNPNVEQIAKKDLENGLKAATNDTQKGNYFDNKTSHGPRLLALINPDRVRAAAPNCEKLFQAVLRRLG